MSLEQDKAYARAIRERLRRAREASAKKEFDLVNILETLSDGPEGDFMTIFGLKILHGREFPALHKAALDRAGEPELDEQIKKLLKELGEGLGDRFRSIDL
ncbi:hypothetical protein [Ktedonospora formicarum]|uniref:Uncharacterized protein n=1 Tax=Ktedonospora formicarum TaxID=2778364 RepID=A0A8J3IAB9_9CHLR|nr:hypothetical protein [Ktedonospora formicarum]GHO48618.1 hypothetical protein KSX_67810 [Ktedonospora formicarum]